MMPIRRSMQWGAAHASLILAFAFTGTTWLSVAQCGGGDDDDTPTPIPTPTPEPTPTPTPTPVPTPTPEPPPIQFPPPVTDPTGAYDLLASGGNDCSLSVDPWQLMYYPRKSVLVDTGEAAGTYQIKDVDVNEDGTIDGQVGIMFLAHSSGTGYTAGTWWADYPTNSQVGFTGAWATSDAVLCANTYVEASAARTASSEGARASIAASSSSVYVEDTRVLITANPASSTSTQVTAEARVIVLTGDGRPVTGATVSLQWLGAITAPMTGSTVNGVAVLELPASLVSTVLGQELAYTAQVLSVSAPGLTWLPDLSDLTGTATLLVTGRSWRLGIGGADVTLSTLRSSHDPDTLYVVAEGAGQVVDLDADVYGENLVDGATMSGTWKGSATGVSAGSEALPPAVNGSWSSSSIDGIGVSVSPAIAVTRAQVESHRGVTVSFTWSVDAVSKAGWTGQQGSGAAAAASITIDGASFD